MNKLMLAFGTAAIFGLGACEYGADEGVYEEGVYEEDEGLYEEEGVFEEEGAYEENEVFEDEGAMGYEE